MANLRAGPRGLTERAAHALAAVMYDFRLQAHANEPSGQFSWRSDLYLMLWTERVPEKPDGDKHIAELIGLEGEESETLPNSFR